MSDPFLARLPHHDPSGMAPFEQVERRTRVGVPVYDFDWRDPHDKGEWRPEWRKVLDRLDRKARKAQDPGADAIYRAAARVLRNPFYIQPNTLGVVISRAVDCMENHQVKCPENDVFQSWVCTAIREACHEVLREEKLWLDPKYAEPADPGRLVHAQERLVRDHFGIDADLVLGKGGA